MPRQPSGHSLARLKHSQSTMVSLGGMPRATTMERWHSPLLVSPGDACCPWPSLQAPLGAPSSRLRFHRRPFVSPRRDWSLGNSLETNAERRGVSGGASESRKSVRSGRRRPGGRFVFVRSRAFCFPGAMKTPARRARARSTYGGNVESASWGGSERGSRASDQK